MKNEKQFICILQSSGKAVLRKVPESLYVQTYNAELEPINCSAGEMALLRLGYGKFSTNT